MIICNYSKFFKLYQPVIEFYGSKIYGDDKHDCMQDIRIYMLKHIERFDPLQASFRYFVYMMVRTGYRRFVYDKKRQVMFEETFDRYPESNESFIVKIEDEDDYDEIFEETLKHLGSGLLVSIFFSLLYNYDNKSYSQIAKIMSIEYSAFLIHKNTILSVIKRILEEKV